MNTEIFFLTAGLALLTAAIACVIAWIAILKLEDFRGQLKKAWEVLPEHRKTLENLTALAASQERGIILFAQKIYQQEETIRLIKEDVVTQKQVKNIIHDALSKELN